MLRWPAASAHTYTNCSFSLTRNEWVRIIRKRNAWKNQWKSITLFVLPITFFVHVFSYSWQCILCSWNNAITYFVVANFSSIRLMFNFDQFPFLSLLLYFFIFFILSNTDECIYFCKYSIGSCKSFVFYIFSNKHNQSKWLYGKLYPESLHKHTRRPQTHIYLLIWFLLLFLY